MSGLRSRAKGKRNERAALKLLAPKFPGYTLRRGWQAHSGKLQCDIEGTPYWIEVKSGKKVILQKAIDQVMSSKDERPPLIVVHEDREPWVVWELYNNDWGWQMWSIDTWSPDPYVLKA